MRRTKQFAWIVLPCRHTPLMSNVLNRLFCLHVIEMLKSGELSIPAVQPCTPHVYTVLLADNSLIFSHVATLICINIPSLCCGKHKIGQVCVYLFWWIIKKLAVHWYQLQSDQLWLGNLKCLHWLCELARKRIFHEGFWLLLCYTDAWWEYRTASKSRLNFPF